MKLMDMSCPHCGAQLRVNSALRHVQCEYCDSILLIDNEQNRTQYDNPEEAGYRFEMFDGVHGQPPFEGILRKAARPLAAALSAGGRRPGVWPPYGV